jgi:hypothetical protein
MGIDVSGANNPTVQGCRVLGNVQTCIRVAGEEALVKGNYTNQLQVVFAERAGSSAVLVLGNDNLIEGNFFNEIAEAGVLVDSGDRNTVIVNKIKGGKTDSVGIVADAQDAQNTMIRGNTVANGGSGTNSIAKGVRLFSQSTTAGTTRTVVKGNTVKGMLVLGIEADYSNVTAGTTNGPYIQNNDVIHDTQASLIGIQVLGNGTGNRVDGGCISGNNVYMGTNTNPGDGVVAQFVTNFSVNDNNATAAEAGTGSNGVEIDDSTECTISVNRILGFENGIVSLSTGSGDSDNNLYAGNHVRGNVTNSLSFAANETNRLSVGNKI